MRILLPPHAVRRKVKEAKISTGFTAVDLAKMVCILGLPNLQLTAT